MPGRMCAAMLVSLLMSVLLDNATAQSCRCVCCKGNFCDAAVAGTFSVSSSSDCGDSACRSKYPEVCPASGSGGTAASSFVAASSSSVSSSSADGSSLATRTSVSNCVACGTSPAACADTTNCFSKCSACYTIVISGNAFTMTPGSVSGCTCYIGTGTIPTDYSGGTIIAGFPDGTAAAVQSTGCTATVQTTRDGASCTSTYAITKITGTSICPSGAASCSSTYSTSGPTSSANSGAASFSFVGMLFSVMAAALVATNVY